MMAGISTALFDVDGTLVDSNYLHTIAWWEAFGQAGYDVPTAAIHRAVGMGSDKLLDALLSADRDKKADDDMRAAHSALYGTFRSRVQPLNGAAELLRACHRQGSRVVLVSSAQPAEFATLRQALDAEDAIDHAVGGADASESKPAPDLVEAALDQVGVQPEQAVFVGDSVWDVRACQRAGVRCIGVRSGGTSGDELRGAGAIAVFDDPADLLDSTAGQLARVTVDG